MKGFLDKKRINNQNKIIKKIILFVFVIVLFSLGLLSLSGKVFNFIGYPIWSAKNSIATFFDKIDYFFSSKSYLSSENKRLLDENTTLKLEMINYQIVENENNELKNILNRFSPNENFVLANILSKPNISPYDTIIIDIGRFDNIKEGDIVYANGVIPIGIIDKVYEKTSLVSLYSSPNKRTEGFIDGPNASVELVGRGGGNFEMIVPLELPIDKSSVVYIPNNNSLVIAIVSEIISENADPFKKVLLNSPVNIQSLKWVEVKK